MTSSLRTPGPIAIVGLLLALIAGCQERATKADLVLRGGPIYTVDAARSWARAVAIRDGKIIDVGPEAEVDAWIGPDTEVIELKERMVLPSFQDAHIHPIAGGVQQTAFLDLMNLNSREEYLAAIEAYAKANPEKPWIRGGGWSMDEFPSAIPDGRDLDLLVPDRPVYLTVPG